MRRGVRLVTRATVIVSALFAVVWLLSRPAVPDAFYAAPPNLPPGPGALIRYEPFDRRVPSGARAWRLLYTTTTTGGRPAVASAIVMVSATTGRQPRPVIAWTHGTTGVVAGCAPSLLADPFAHVPALRALLDEGWIYVATDYVGLGTAGPHPYLIGDGEARAALDAVRATRQVAEFEAGESTVVWGHSQGGHAALWTGILAPDYAPDVRLAGVAAAAPATDLPALLEAVHATPIGRIMSSYMLRAYTETYDDVRVDAYVGRWSRLLVGEMAARCLEGRQTLVSVAEALMIGGSVFTVSPTTGPLGRRLGENVPDRDLPQPLLIAQGLADVLVLPDVQRAFVQRRCDAGQVIDFRAYRDRDHLSLVAPDSPLTADLMDWTRERLAGTPPASACRGLD